VALGEVLRRSDEQLTLSLTEMYREVTVKLWGKGVTLRRLASGSQIAGSRRFVARQGQFILSRIDARNGACGVVPPDLDGAVVSNDFPTFNADPGRIDSAYLGWLGKTASFVDLCRAASEGTTNRVRLQEDRFLKLTIPLPPLAEQRRIVARIEELAAKIEEARRLRAGASSGADALRRSIRALAATGRLTKEWREAHRLIRPAVEILSRLVPQSGQVKSRKRSPLTLPDPPEVPASWVVRTSGDLQDAGALLDIQDGNHGGDYPRKSEFGSDGVPFVTALQIDENGVRISDAPRLPTERAKQLRIGFARGGDVLLTHNASVGDVAIAPADSGQFLLGTSVTYWRCNPAALLPQYLLHFMKSDWFQGQLQAIMKQTTRNQVSVLKQVNLWVCVPPIEEQRAIVTVLDEVLARTSVAQDFQSQSTAELDALLPSILDKAFKGEL